MKSDVKFRFQRIFCKPKRSWRNLPAASQYHCSPPSWQKKCFFCLGPIYWLFFKGPSIQRIGDWQKEADTPNSAWIGPKYIIDPVFNPETLVPIRGMIIWIKHGFYFFNPCPKCLCSSQVSSHYVYHSRLNSLYAFQTFFLILRFKLF